MVCSDDALSCSYHARPAAVIMLLRKVASDHPCGYARRQGSTEQERTARVAGRPAGGVPSGAAVSSTGRQAAGAGSPLNRNSKTNSSRKTALPPAGRQRPRAGVPAEAGRGTRARSCVRPPTHQPPPGGSLSVASGPCCPTCKATGRRRGLSAWAAYQGRSSNIWQRTSACWSHPALSMKPSSSR